MRARTVLVAGVAMAAGLCSFACGGGGGAASPPPSPIGVALSAATLEVYQGGTPASVDVTVSRPTGTSRSVTLTVPLLPAGVTAEIESPEDGNNGTITFTAAGQDNTAGTFQVSVRASDSVSTGMATLTLTVAIVARIGAPTGERIDTFMSTSFQPASWTDDFFVRHPEATGPLDDLHPQHINVQVLDRDIPQRSATSWDFSYIDGILNPIFTTGDHSPLYQIAMGPAFMYNQNDPQMGLRDATYQEFADYCVKLVQYYNTGGFTDGGGIEHVSASAWPITYWGIYNEPNINGFSPDEYVSMYNVVVPQMRAEDPTLKFVAVELADFSDEPQRYLPTFVANVTAPVDVVATHYYSSCNQRDTDQQLLDTIPTFVDHVSYIYSQLQSKPALANVPVWVTENNVNADWNAGNGMSNCNPGQTFVTDLRGSSAFFAAWRPYVFSRLAQAGARALHHWGFNADQQYGEVDGGNGQLYLSYWVDYWLARYFASPPGADLLELDASDTATVEILPTLQDDGTVVVMIANHAVRSSTDNNGTGAPRSVLLDVSALGSFTSATQLTIDATTNAATGPAPQTITPQAQMEITLPGYGVTFLTLN